MLCLYVAIGADACAVASLLLARFCALPTYKIAGEEFNVRKPSLENQTVFLGKRPDCFRVYDRKTRTEGGVSHQRRRFA
jgi:hypothetical protein